MNNECRHRTIVILLAVSGYWLCCSASVLCALIISAKILPTTYISHRRQVLLNEQEVYVKILTSFHTFSFSLMEVKIMN